MKKYLGVKQIEAEPLNLGDYNKFRGWKIPSNEDPKKEGYKIVYPDGHISWSPKEVFDKAYRETTALTFGLAIEALKKGKLVARHGWNGKGIFIFLVPPSELTAEFVINTVKQVPQSLKDQIGKEFSHSENEKKLGLGPDNTIIKFPAFLGIKSADESIVNGWTPSQTDQLAEDWYIVK